MAFKGLLKQAQRYLDRVQNPYPPVDRLLYSFSSAEDLIHWKVFTDQQYGGQTTAELVLSEDEPGTAEFHGNISTEMHADTGEGKRMQRSGFAGINTEEVQGQYLDTEGFDALGFRVRGDGRKYIASLRTDNWIVGSNSHDVWQAFLFARKGEWQEVVLPLGRFLQTHKGRLVETQSEMNPHRILSLGISLAAASAPGGGTGQHGVQAPFCLGLDWVKGMHARE